MTGIIERENEINWLPMELFSLSIRPDEPDRRAHFSNNQH